MPDGLGLELPSVRPGRFLPSAGYAGPRLAGTCNELFTQTRISGVSPAATGTLRRQGSNDSSTVLLFVVTDLILPALAEFSAGVSTTLANAPPPASCSGRTDWDCRCGSGSTVAR